MAGPPPSELGQKRITRRDLLRTVVVLGGTIAAEPVVEGVLQLVPGVQAEVKGNSPGCIERYIINNTDVRDPHHLPLHNLPGIEKETSPELIVPEGWYTLEGVGDMNLAVSATLIRNDPNIAVVANERGIEIIKLIPENNDMREMRRFPKQGGWIYEIHPDGNGGAYCTGQGGVHYININGSHRFYPKPRNLPGDPPSIEYDSLGLPFGDYDSNTGYFWCVPRFSWPKPRVLRLTPETGEWKQYPFPYRGLNFSIKVGPDGKIWVGSLVFHSRWRGLGYIDPTDGSFGEVLAYTGQSVANLETTPDNKLLVSGDFGLHYDSNKVKPGELSVFNSSTNQKEWRYQSDPDRPYPGERILKTVLYPNKGQLDLFCRGGDMGFPGITTIDWEKEFIGNIFDRWPNKAFAASPDGVLKMFGPWWGKPLVRVE